MKHVYLDNAAGTPLTETAKLAYDKCRDMYYDPNGLYEPAVEAKAMLDTVRAEIAKTLQVKPNELIFTSGATEANNLAIAGVLQATEGTGLCSDIEHASVREPMLTVSGSNTIAVDDTGLIDLDDLKQKITPLTTLISVMAVNNETGVIQDFRAIRKVVDEVLGSRTKEGNDKPLYLHSDASAFGQSKVGGPRSLRVDLMTINSPKVGGPRSIGLLVALQNVEMHPQMLGGGQQAGRRSGSEDLALTSSFAEALKQVSENHDSNQQKLGALQQELEKGLKDLGAEIVSVESDRSPHITMALFPGQDNEMLLYKLSQQGIFVGLGSACHARSTEPSKVLTALGYSDKQARSALRFSFSIHNTSQEIAHTIDVLRSMLINSTS